MLSQAQVAEISTHDFYASIFLFLVAPVRLILMFFALPEHALWLPAPSTDRGKYG